MFSGFYIGWHWDGLIVGAIAGAVSVVVALVNDLRQNRKFEERMKQHLPEEEDDDCTY